MHDDVELVEPEFSLFGSDRHPPVLESGSLIGAVGFNVEPALPPLAFTPGEQRATQRRVDRMCSRRLGITSRVALAGIAAKQEG
jgi:hypothetical protein